MTQNGGRKWMKWAESRLSKNALGEGTPASRANVLVVIAGGVGGGVVGAVVDAVAGIFRNSGDSSGFGFWGCLAGVGVTAGFLVFRDRMREKMSRHPFSPFVFSDEGGEADWSPLHPNETSCPNRRLEDMGGSKICFVGTGRAVARHMFIGICVLGALILYLLSKNVDSAMVAGGSALVAGAGAGLFLLLKLAQEIMDIRRTIYFDKNSGRFWKGGLGGLIYPSEKEWAGDISYIIAIQILDKSCDDGTRVGYELNLILPDRRLNLSDHTDLNLIRADGARLATFLGKEVWDKTTISDEQNPQLS